MKTIILIAIIASVASPIYAEEAVEVKKQEKRGVLGLGYGGYYSGLGVSGLGGYGGYRGYGQYNAPLVSHDSLLAYSHDPAVSYGSHLGSGYHGSYYASIPRHGYNGLGYSRLGYSHGLGQGLNYIHGGNYW